MVWAWMLWSPYALATECYHGCGQGCFGHHMFSEHAGYCGLGIDVCSWNTNAVMVVDMDVLVIICSWNTNDIMVWAWMLWSAYALGA